MLAEFEVWYFVPTSSTNKLIQISELFYLTGRFVQNICIRHVLKTLNTKPKK